MRKYILTFPFIVSILYAESSMFLDYEKAVSKESLKRQDSVFIKPKLLLKTPELNDAQKESSTKKDNLLNSSYIDTTSTVTLIEQPDEPKEKTILQSVKSIQQKLLSRAKEFLGTPYGFGNKGDIKTDCSGFTQQVFSSFGVNLPRSASEQIHIGEKVDLQDLQVGDLLFYKTYKSDPSHVAIYAGEGKIIHASYSAKKVQYDSIDKDYYKNRFIGAKRIALNDTNE